MSSTTSQEEQQFNQDARHRHNEATFVVAFFLLGVIVDYVKTTFGRTMCGLSVGGARKDDDDIVERTTATITVSLAVVDGGDSSSDNETC
jgi:hypothetical protein